MKTRYVLPPRCGHLKTRSSRRQDWYLIERAALHSALKTLAISDEGEGPPVHLLLGCELVDLDKTQASVTLRSNETYHGDLIVGADGVKVSRLERFHPSAVCPEPPLKAPQSWTRAYIAPEATPSSYGKACYRWLVPWSAFASNNETAAYGQRQGNLLQWAEADRRIICYPCAEHRTANMAAFVPAEETQGQSHG